MDAGQTPETALVQRLSALVDKEHQILEKLSLLRFDEATIGREQFSEPQIAEYRAMVERHSQQVTALGQQLRSEHMPGPSLNELRDVTRVMLADYGELKGSDWLPANDVMVTLERQVAASNNTIQRLSAGSTELHEETMAGTMSGNPDFDDLHRLGDAQERLHAITMATIERAFSEEPGATARQSRECFSDLLSIQRNLQALHSQRWWDEGKSRESAKG